MHLRWDCTGTYSMDDTRKRAASSMCARLRSDRPHEEIPFMRRRLHPLHRGVGRVKKREEELTCTSSAQTPAQTRVWCWWAASLTQRGCRQGMPQIATERGIFISLLLPSYTSFSPRSVSKRASSAFCKRFDSSERPSSLSSPLLIAHNGVDMSTQPWSAITQFP